MEHAMNANATDRPLTPATATYRVSLSTAPWEAWVATLDAAARALGPLAESRQVSRVLRINGAYAGLATLTAAEAAELHAIADRSRA